MKFFRRSKPKQEKIKKRVEDALEETSSHTLDQSESKYEQLDTDTSGNDVGKLIEILNSAKENAIKPHIDYNKNRITYPLLSQIGKDEDDVAFLEKLASPEVNILQKFVYEKLVVCPEHPGSFSTNLRLCCSSCSSTDIEKLLLVEHKVCGHLAEKKDFQVDPKGDATYCPSCKKTIRDVKKEIRIPGMWYKCNSCKSKFDNCKIQLHCRQFNHNFEINQAEIIPISFYKPTSEAKQVTMDTFSLIQKIKESLASHGFFTQDLPTVKGVSGIEHRISIYGSNDKHQSIAIFVEGSETEIDDSQVNNMLVKVHDISPTFTIFVGIPSVSESARMLAGARNIEVVTGTNLTQILTTVDKLLSKYSPVTTRMKKEIK